MCFDQAKAFLTKQYILQCSDVVGWRQEGHPTCKISEIPSMEGLLELSPEKNNPVKQKPK